MNVTGVAARPQCHYNRARMALAVLYALLQLLFLSGLGFLLGRLRGWPREIFHGFNRFVATVALPVSFFASIAQTDPAAIREGWIFPLLAAAVILVGLGLSAGILALVPASGEERRAGMGLATFGNSGYLPIALMGILPVTLPGLAERFGFADATMYIGIYLLVNSPALWSLGNWLVAGTGRPRIDELITPPFIGIAAGLAASALGLGPLIANPALPVYHLFQALDRVGDTTVPLIMIALGAMIGELSLPAGSRRTLVAIAAAVSAVRFLLLPAVFFAGYLLVLRPLGLDPTQLLVAFLMMNIPPATNLSVMVSRVGRNEDVVSFVLLVTYIAYLAVLPLTLLAFFAVSGL